jgi:hypothetical protein
MRNEEEPMKYTSIAYLSLLFRLCCPDAHWWTWRCYQMSNLMHLNEATCLPKLQSEFQSSDAYRYESEFEYCARHPFAPSSFCTKLVSDVNQTFPRSVCPHKCERPLLSTVERWSLWNAKSQYVGCWIPIVSHTSYVSLMLHIKRVNYWTLMPTSNHMLSWVKDTAIATAKSLARATLRYFVRLY